MTYLYAIGLLTAWLLMTALIRHDITKGNRIIMSIQDDLTNAVAALKGKDDQIIALVTSQNTTIANLNAAITQLQGQVNAPQIDPAVVQQAINDLNAEAERVTAALPQVAPAPTGTP